MLFIPFVRFMSLASSTAVLLAFLLAGCGPSIPATIKIGVAQPLSGPSAARGKDLVDGAKMAADELNAAGYKIAGKSVQIEIVPMDDKADKEEAKKVAKALVDQKVTAVIGHLFSDATEATIPIYRSGNVLQLFTSSATELKGLGEGNAFRLIAHDEQQARAVVGYATDMLRAGKAAILYENSAFANAMARDVTAGFAKLDKKIEINERVDAKVADFSDFVAKLKAAPPDVLVAVLRDGQLLPLFSKLKEAGLSDLKVIVTSIAKTRTLAAAPANITSVFATSGALDTSEFAAGPAFVAKFRAIYKADPVWAAHYAYDAMYIMASAMRRAESMDPVRLRATLTFIEANAPVTEYMRFNAEGEQRHGMIAIYQKRDSKWEMVVRADNW